MAYSGEITWDTFEQFNAVMEGMTHRKRLTTLQELTNAAVFVASDEGSAITGIIVNLTAGMIVNNKSSKYCVKTKK